MIDESENSVGSKRSSEAISFNNSMQSDPLVLSNSDHPGMSLTSVQFDGNNYAGWRRQVRMALGAKLKLGFVDGTCARPALGDADLERWIRCDYMVTCWLLHSMVAELSNAFMYANSARDLWLEIAERYGQSNAPLLFQLRQEISQISQVNSSIAGYYVKLKKCWDEINSLVGVPSCTCGIMTKCSCAVMTKILDLENQNRLMQFLMNLNSDYNSTRNQILAMDPLPKLNKVYSILQQVERNIRGSCVVPDPVAFMAFPDSGVGGAKSDSKKAKSGVKKLCVHCNEEGHLVDQCFELIGYPDWYKGKKGKRGGKLMAQVATAPEVQYDTPMQEATQIPNAHLNPSFVNAICQELIKVMKGKGVDMTQGMSSGTGSSTTFNFAGPFE